MAAKAKAGCGYHAGRTLSLSAVGLGLRIPEDIAVATTSVLDGNLDTGANQNSREIGRVAVSTLASLILENERGIPVYQRRISVEGRWGDGASMPRRQPVKAQITPCLFWRWRPLVF